MSRPGLVDPRELRAPIFRSLATIFKRGYRRRFQAQQRLAQAYQNVFWGNPSREDQEIVLSDLASESGFYRVTPAGQYSTDQLWQNEGKRYLFARIFDSLSLSEADMRALETAARRESAVDLDPTESD